MIHLTDVEHLLCARCLGLKDLVVVGAMWPYRGNVQLPRHPPRLVAREGLQNREACVTHRNLDSVMLPEVPKSELAERGGR